MDVLFAYEQAKNKAYTIQKKRSTTNFDARKTAEMYCCVYNGDGGGCWKIEKLTIYPKMEGFESIVVTEFPD